MNKDLTNIVIGTMLVLIIGSVGWYLYSNYSFLFFLPPTTDTVQLPTAPKLPGSFVLTMQPTVPETAVSSIYRMMADSGAQSVLSSTTNYYTPSFSTDNRIAVVANGGDIVSQLVIADIGDQENATVITPPAPTLYAGASDWSSDNKYVVYEAITALPAIDDVDSANSHIVILNTETEEQQIIDDGTSPLFYTDGSILYLKSDGVYRLTEEAIASSTPAERVAYFDGYEANRTSRIALSQDGGLLAVTHPHNAIFTVHQVLGHETFALSEGISIVQTAFWPVFSPDGTTLAFIDMQKTDEGIATKAIAVVDLVSGKQRIVANLNAYNDRYLSLGAWLQ